MRIIGGEKRGKLIQPPLNYKARPTTDFAKEGLFNILQNEYDFEEISVLDLFSGTGSISFEFASRGCKNITSVEMNSLHYNFIKRSAAEFGFKDLFVVRQNVFDFLQICKLQYDIVFADPPYELEGLDLIPQKVMQSSVLKEEGVLILEHPASFDFSANELFFKKKKYGNVHFSFFRKK